MLEGLQYLVAAFASFVSGCGLVALVFFVPVIDLSLLHSLPAFGLTFFFLVLARWVSDAHEGDDEKTTLPVKDAAAVDVPDQEASDDDQGWRRRPRL